MNEETIQNIIADYPKYKENNLFGRYITLQDIQPLIDQYRDSFTVTLEGESFLKKPIYSIRLGNGSKKILIWSQMHGNESTGTKALFDFLSLIAKYKNQKEIKELLHKVTFLFVPMLNPDGAVKYSRLNAQDIDLNRDAVAKKAPESQILRNILERFKPDFCFNLHDQRTIFSVGDDNRPATISLLAPSENENREITTNRKHTMEVIVSMFNTLNTYIPNQIGRYTDEFYPTATGDNFQKDGYPTILIEAGHYKNDYQREMTRKFNFIALLSGFLHISNNLKTNFEQYFSIPNNKKDYFDLFYTNILLENKKNAIGITYKEELKDNFVVFKTTYKDIINIDNFGYNKLFNKQLIISNKNELKALFNE